MFEKNDSVWKQNLTWLSERFVEFGSSPHSSTQMNLSRVQTHPARMPEISVFFLFSDVKLEKSQTGRWLHIWRTVNQCAQCLVCPQTCRGVALHKPLSFKRKCLLSSDGCNSLHCANKIIIHILTLEYANCSLPSWPPAEYHCNLWSVKHYSGERLQG